MQVSDHPTSGWRRLIPHAGTMCLLEEIVAWDATSIYMRTSTHRGAAHPLRSDGRLRALHLCEYGAQAMAVHGGLVASASGGTAAPGYLVSLRGVEFSVERVDDLAGALDVRAECLLGDGGGWQYAFRVEHDGIVLASGRAAVIAKPPARACARAGVAIKASSRPGPERAGRGRACR